jgi:hypothetical protein
MLKLNEGIGNRWPKRASISNGYFTPDRGNIFRRQALFMFVQTKKSSPLRRAAFLFSTQRMAGGLARM